MKKRILPALVLSAMLGATAPAADAAQFSGVYVFGDSLSDAGYYRGFLASLGLPSSVVSQLGSFTTNPDPVWAELVSQFYGITPNPSNVGNGNIFAQGGARVSASSASTPPGFAQRPVSTQIDEFLARGNGAADPNALYAIWAGGNDFLQNSAAFQAGQISQAQFQANVLAAATAEVGQVARLRNAGARYILVFALPDIGIAPASLAGGAAAAAGATALSAGYNTTLFTGLASAGIRVIPVDVFSLITDVRNNAAAFGITNTTGIACGPFPGVTTSGNSQFCLPSNFVAPNANLTYLFADSVHPTGIVQRITADYVLNLLEGPSQYGLLAEAAVASRSSHMRMLNDGLAKGRGADVGRFNVFASTDSSEFEIDTSPGNYGVDSTRRSLSVGVTVRASDTVTLGAAFGNARSKANFGADAGSFKLNEKVWSLFGAVKWGGFYANAVASNADLDYRDVQRTIVLGNVRRTARTSPEGSNASFSFATGYDFRLGSLEIGPTVSVVTQDVKVNGFTESTAEAGSAALRIFDQTRKSEIWSAGARASLNLGAWTPWLRVTADKERRDEERLVTANPMSLDPIGNSYDIPAYRPDTSFMTAALGVNGTITRNVGLSASVYRISGRSGVKEDGVNLLLSLGF